MQAPLYDLYITGKLVAGVTTEQARDDLAALFKTGADKVARYVTGQPALFKRGIDKAEAMKYKAALHQIGILVVFKSHQQQAEGVASKPLQGSTKIAESSTTKTAEGSSTNPAEGSFTKTAQGSSSIPNGNTGDQRHATTPFSLAAVGSELLRQEEKARAVTTTIDTSAIHMVSVFAEPDVPPPVAVASPDTSGFSIAEAGAQLLQDKPEPPPPLPLDLDSISLAPAGSPLDQLKEDVIPLQPNTEGLDIAPAGADLLAGEQHSTPPPAPDTSHLSVSAER